MFSINSENGMIDWVQNINSTVNPSVIEKLIFTFSNDGYFVFGLGRDRKNDIVIKVLKNKKLEVFEKKVYKRKYKIQKIDGLPEKKVTPPKEVYERIKRENKIIGNARAINLSLIHI